LFGMLAATLRRYIGDGTFKHLQEGLLDTFAGNVPRDADVLAGLADLIDLVDEDNMYTRCHAP